MTFTREDGRDQLHIRCSADLKERIQKFADETGKSQSDVVREAVDKHVPGGTDDGPADPDLRETWEWLRHRTDNHGRVSSKAAINELSQTLSMKEQFVKEARLKPLERNGWIRPRHAYIKVVEP